MSDARQPNDSNDDAQTHGDAAGVFDRLFGTDDALEQAKARTKQRRQRAMKHATAARKSLKGKVQSTRKIRPAWLQFIAEVLKTPANQGAAYRRVYPNANEKTAYRRANELLNRPEIASEIQRRQNLRAAAARISRTKVEDALANVFTFDIRRFYYSEAEAVALNAGKPRADHVAAGDPKKPHHLDDEAAQVIESYEKKVGKFGESVKMKATPRLGAAELMAKLRGWVKDDGRPPITATFTFNLGPQPSPQHPIKDVEAVPEALYGAMGLRDEHEAPDPMPPQVDANGDPVRSIMPPGYERSRSVRVGGRGRELAEDFESVSESIVK